MRIATFQQIAGAVTASLETSTAPGVGEDRNLVFALYYLILKAPAPAPRGR